MFKDLFNDILKDLGITGYKRPPNLKCPNCYSVMKKISIKILGNYGNNYLELDFCQECESLWFDRGELVKALEIDLKDISKYFPSKTKQSVKGSGKRICPICQKQLTLVNYSKDSNIWVDICSNGCGIFLDSGELELIKLYSLNPLQFSSQTQQTNQEKQPLMSAESTTSFEEPSTKQDSDTKYQFLNDVKNLAQRIQKVKDQVVYKVKQIEDAIKSKNILELKKLMNKQIFAEELNELGLINQEIRNMYQKYGNQKQIEDLQTHIQNIIKFIDIRSNSLKDRIAVEIEFQQEKEKEISSFELTNINKSSEIAKSSEQKAEQRIEQKIEPKMEPKVEPRIERRDESKDESNVESNVEPKVESKIEQKIEQKVEQKSEYQPIQQPSTKVENTFNIEKIRLPSFENLLFYLTLNDKFIVFSENKIYLLVSNLPTYSFQEIKIKELNFRIKKVKKIDDKIYLSGSSGSMLIIDQDFNVVNFYKIGYSDILDFIIYNNQIFALSSGRLYTLQEGKVVEEKSININFLEVFDGKIIGGSSSILIFNEKFEKLQEYQTGSYQQIKKVKVLGNDLFILGSGLLAKFDNQKIVKYNLPKSYLEVNDIDFVNGSYYICSNSGGFYKTDNFDNYQEIRLNTFDNIFAIAYYNNKIHLLCSGSNLLIIS